MTLRFALAALVLAVSPAMAQAPIDGAALLAGPPAAGSPGAAHDDALVRAGWDAERLAKAIADNALDPFAAFDDVLGGDFTAAKRPATKRVFDALLPAVGQSAMSAKERWNRPRPFVADPSLPTCLPPTDALRTNGSYPSGHAALGWAWGLVLSELAPARADALLARGRSYGDSRVVCGFHYPSDVESGRTIAAAAVARLHGEASFRVLLDAARTEFANAP